MALPEATALIAHGVLLDSCRCADDRRADVLHAQHEGRFSRDEPIQPNRGGRAW